MSIALPILLLVVAGSALAILHLVRPAFRFGWLIAIGLTSVSWVLVLIWQFQLPISLALPLWKSAEQISASPNILVNSLTWPYALGLVSLVLAVLLTAPARVGFPKPYRWAMSLGLTALGLLGVLAGDVLTLVLVWAALDLAEVGLTLRWAKGPDLGSRAVVAFAVRLSGIVLVLLGRVLSAANTQGVGLAAILPPDGLLLVSAAALRLGVLPVPLPYTSSPEMRGGLGITLQLSSAAASIALLSRIPSASLESPVAPILIVVCAAAAIYAGSMWLRSPDQFSGRPFWMVGVSSLAVASALRGSAAGATAWGVALLVVGAGLFLPSVAHRWLSRATLVGAWSLSALPFSLTASAWIRGAGPLDWSLPAFVVAQALLLAGFIQHALRPLPRPATGADQVWVRGIYPAGIVLLLLVPIALGLWGWDGAFQFGTWPAGAAAVAVAAALVWAKARIPALSPMPSDWLPRQPGGLRNWLYRQIAGVYDAGARLSDGLAGVLEGEAGIMWSLLFLALFVSLIVGRNP